MMEATKDKKDKQKNTGKTDSDFIAALFFAFNLYFFSPMEFYYSNAAEITIGIKYILITLIILSAAVFTAVFLILHFTKKKANTIAKALVAGLGLAMYIQSNFLNSGMGTLDGHTYSPGALKIAVNLLIWAALLAVPFLIAKFRKDFFPKFVIGAASMVLAVEIITLVTVRIQLTQSESYAKIEAANSLQNGTRVVSTNDEFVYSRKNNLIVLIPDEFDSRFFDLAAEQAPETIAAFSGFEYFSNAVGMYSGTTQAIPYIFSGQLTDAELILDNTAFFDAVQSKMKLDIYSSLNGILPQAVIEKYAENCVVKNVTAENLANIGVIFTKITMLRHLPEVCKSLFFVYSGEINNVFASLHSYQADNLVFYDGLKNEIELTDEECCKIIYIHGLHDPFNMTADLKPAKHSDVTEDDVAVGLNRLIAEYLDVLKKAGVYDNSTIVITADHGRRYGGNPKYPLLMIKKKDAPGEPMKISKAPVSHEDVYPTLMYFAGEPTGARTVFDIAEDEQRERFYAETGEYITETEKEHEIFRGDETD